MFDQSTNNQATEHGSHMPHNFNLAITLVGVLTFVYHSIFAPYTINHWTGAGSLYKTSQNYKGQEHPVKNNQ